MKRTILFTIVLSVGYGVCIAQSRKATELGILKVAIPSLPYELVDPKDNSAATEVFVTNGRLTTKIPYVGRTTNKGLNGQPVSDTDEYAISLKEGFYRLFIKDNAAYRLPNFFVKAGETVNFNIPQHRFAWDEVCKGDIKMLKSFDYEEPHIDQLKKYSMPPYRKIQTEALVLDIPFEMVVRYCGRERNNSSFQYKSAQIYYKNYFIAADNIILKKEAMVIEAFAREVSPTNEFQAPIIQIDGKEIGSRAVKLIFDLRTGKLLDR